MASILQFVPRQASSQNWTDAERARLYEFAAAMAESCGVRIDFGQTDDGDPWCVVLDDNEDVLVHIARIEGSFVAHAVAQDLVAQANELSTALDRALARSGDRSDVVIPFPTNRSSQIVTAVLVAAAFSWSSESEAHEAPGWLNLADGGDEASRARGDGVTIALPADALDSLVGLAAQAPSGAAPALYGPPLSAVADVAAVTSVQADPRPETSQRPAATVAADPAMPLPDEPAYFARQPAEEGGSGAPQPAVNPPAPRPVAQLVGTSGDDSLLLGPSMITSGGTGADQFVIAAPAFMDGGSQPLGVILDFSIDEGDALQFLPSTPGSEAAVVSISTVGDILSGAIPGHPPVAGVRLGVDFDADGGEDGFLMLGNISEADAVRMFGAAAPADSPKAPLDAMPPPDAPVTGRPTPSAGAEQTGPAEMIETIEPTEPTAPTQPTETTEPVAADPIDDSLSVGFLPSPEPGPSLEPSNLIG